MTYLPDKVGPFELFSPTGAASGIGWLILHGDSWLPGSYANRDTALLAIGLTLGGDGAEQLAELCDQHAKGRHITIEDITNHAARSNEND
ncbi:hypothetical protein [Kitasatospora brasiliensis]|uniref:hypothetical protein n=1 Tax=Kitasatospora brasiliensis TaxID=3058040 RepID=UPI00293059D6|nr:hypothetical protein [Kitasatospora sp. K002]